MKTVVEEHLTLFLEELTRELSCHEANFNNADRTSEQRCYTDEELRLLIIECMRGMRE